MQCEKCVKKFSSPQALSRHQRESCPLRFVTVTKRESSGESEARPSKQPKLSRNNDASSSLVKPFTRIRQDAASISLGNDVEKINSAFKCRICSYRFSALEHFIIHNDFFESVKEKVLSIITKYLGEFITLKINFELFSLYAKPESELSDTKSFNTKNRVITGSDLLTEVFENFKSEIMVKAENFQEKDSGVSFFSFFTNFGLCCIYF